METPTGLILKGSESIILSESLQQEAIELVHRGSHLRVASMKRKLSFFHDKGRKVD